MDAVVKERLLRSGDRLRITAQLIQAATDRHLWSETYERDLRDVAGSAGRSSPSHPRRQSKSSCRPRSRLD